MILICLQDVGHRQSDSDDSGTESDDEHDEEDGMTEGNILNYKLLITLF